MKKRSLFLCLALIAALVLSSSLAIASVEAYDLSRFIVEDVEEEDIVPKDPELEYINTETLMTLMSHVSPTCTDRASYDEYMPEWDFVIVDSRPESAYNEGHINGAINIPDAEFEARSDLLPEDKDKKIIFYCGGLHCPLSADSARKAEELGYTNVHVYQEGVEYWRAAGNYFTTTAEHVEELIGDSVVSDESRKPYLLVDTRAYSAYFSEHIPHSISMDVQIFKEKYKGLIPRDKDIEIITYCGGFQ
ncbi:rhodanese-like domain-containing protein [Fuchsiella alkaliacetigena]|uniref:rhodanese-like domain-containing protein n=1 Tax=Fuchsiella alkaliacetigena TaxID=957042 RepID=UPI00200AB7A8|nr:rhodanese-like domain-containing protein [Fuchsiella alkaliacetigena]MCK8825471.1 hypothetical protein [Fuchsiella alkaliacetigena]